MLVTGDIVHSPHRSTYERARIALDALDIPYFVCPGNHDRSPLGNGPSRALRWITNALSFFKGPRQHGVRWMDAETASVFDQAFSDTVASVYSPRRYDSKGGWRIHVHGIDSSRHADHFARGFIHPSDLKALCSSAAAEGDGPDLLLLLVHHHVQAVRRLEAKLAEDARGINDLTHLVNAGNVIEHLARSRFDLVLHGHQHTSHWSRYGSMEDKLGDVMVVGAGSATGNSSSRGCQLDNYPSYNIIELRRDRNAFLHVMAMKDGTWRQEERIEMLDPPQWRRRKVSRKVRVAVDRVWNSFVSKHVRFTQEQDILVNWVFTNWWLSTRAYLRTISNSTGVPSNLTVHFVSEEGERLEAESVLERSGSRDHEWHIRAVVPDQCFKKTTRIEISYTWRGGALLSAEAMDAARQEQGALGEFRNAGFEDSSIRVEQEATAASLHVTLPPRAMQDRTVGIVVTNANGDKVKEDSGTVRRGLARSGPCSYSLSIAYPLVGWLYTIQWKPARHGRSSVVAETDQLTSAEWGRILREFMNSWASEFLQENDTARFSIYLATSPAFAVCLAQSHWQVPGLTSPPARERVRIRPLTALGEALLGRPTWARRPEQDDQLASLGGFAADERGLLTIPLRPVVHGTESEPWGAIRIGLLTDPAAERIETDSRFKERSERSVALLLSAVAARLDGYVTRGLDPRGTRGRRYPGTELQ